MQPAEGTHLCPGEGHPAAATVTAAALSADRRGDTPQRLAAVHGVDVEGFQALAGSDSALVRMQHRAQRLEPLGSGSPQTCARGGARNKFRSRSGKRAVARECRKGRSAPDLAAKHRHHKAVVRRGVLVGPVRAAQLLDRGIR